MVGENFVNADGGVLHIRPREASQAEHGIPVEEHAGAAVGGKVGELDGAHGNLLDVVVADILRLGVLAGAALGLV